jgi:hypothetical protein
MGAVFELDGNFQGGCSLSGGSRFVCEGGAKGSVQPDATLWRRNAVDSLVVITTRSPV